MAESTTVQASVLQLSTAVGGGVSAVAALDGRAQLVAVVTCAIIGLLALWIMRERVKKFAAGVK